MIHWLRTLTFAPKEIFLAWARHYEVQYHNPGMYIYFPCSLRYDDIKAIKIGEQVGIGSFSEIVVFASSSYSKVVGKLMIGERTIIGSHANIRAAGGEIHIGKNCLLAQQVSLIASGHIIETDQNYRDAPWDETKTGIMIEENVWIGAGVTILPGCRIGRNVVIGAGSVVTKSIPENEVWAGVPARKIREINHLRKSETLVAKLE